MASVESEVTIKMCGKEAETLRSVLSRTTVKNIEESAECSEFDAVFAFQLVCSIADQIPIIEKL